MPLNRFLILASFTLILPVLSACTTNPATGRQQFTGLMSPQQEVSVGASEHEKVVKQYGLYPDQAVQAYVNQIGQKLLTGTENTGVQYKFYVVDSEMVNAFALPGGYVYVTRGLMALANSEAELAGVMAHEIGHVTGRHSAERYSRGVVTGLGAAVLGAAIDNPDAARAINVGSDLYLKSYSRDQEYESDMLGVRYLSRAGYDPFAMASFLNSLQQESTLESQESGQSGPPDFFSTHPNTGDRVSRAAQAAGQYENNPNAVTNREGYLRKIDGLAYGSGGKEGFTRGQTFYHPGIGFKMTMPNGFEIVNQPSEVIGKGPNGAVVVFDFDSTPQPYNPETYLAQIWLKGQGRSAVEPISVNGMNAATTGFAGNVNGRPVDLRLVAIEWGQGKYARLQMAIPQGADPALVEAYKRTTYSFMRLSEAEKNSVKAQRVRIVTAGGGDTPSSMARRQSIEKNSEAHFRVLNGLGPNEGLKAGQVYKVVE